MWKFKTLLGLALAVVLTACNSVKVEYDGETESVKAWKNMAILEVVPAPPGVPSEPLLYASIYEKNFSDIYNDVNKIFEKNTEKLVSELGASFEKYSKKPTIYGKNLFSILTKEAAEKNGISVFPLNSGNEDFPYIKQPSYALNLFNFEPQSYPSRLFRDDDEVTAVKLQIKKICEFLKVDGVVVAVTGAHTISIGLFGSNGQRQSITGLYFFNKDGERICIGEGKGEYSDGGSSDIVHYEKVFNDYFKMCDYLGKKLYLDKDPDED